MWISSSVSAHPHSAYYFAMNKLGRILLQYVLSTYTIYNDVVEEYLLQVDDLFVGLSDSVYQMIANVKNFNNVIKGIQSNNEIVKIYKGFRPKLANRSSSLEEFKVPFSVNHLNDCYNPDTNMFEKISEMDRETVLTLYNGLGRSDTNYPLLYQYLDRTRGQGGMAGQGG
jgi:hypothetical protein